MGVQRADVVFQSTIGRPIHYLTRSILGHDRVRTRKFGGFINIRNIRRRVLTPSSQLALESEMGDWKFS